MCRRYQLRALAEFPYGDLSNRVASCIHHSGRGIFVLQFTVELFKYAVQGSPTAMAILGDARAGRPRVYANAAFEALTGFTADDIEHHGLGLLHGEETDPRHVAQVQSCLLEGRELRLLVRSYRKHGPWFWNLLHVIPLNDGRRKLGHFLLMLRDVTEQHTQIDRLVRHAQRDPLTGLANRSVLQDRVEQLIERARQQGGSFALVFVDIDRFKQINDTFGHEAGDEILKLVGARLTHGARVGDTVCRIGGDEFVLLLPLTLARIDAASVQRRISAALEREVVLDGRRFQLSCSMGVSVYPTDGRDCSSLFRSADLQMYGNKASRGPQGGRYPIEAAGSLTAAKLH